MNSSLRARIPGRLFLACAVVAPLVSLRADVDSASDKNNPPIQLPEVVVTARRVPENPLNVPAYTQVITRDQIRESGATNLIDLLESQANLQFNSFVSSPTSANISLRGTGGSSAIGNGRTLVLLDGIRTNRPDQGQFNWLQFNLQSIESVEVIQGPQGAFYGDNAVGGVIKINTLGAPAKSGGGAQVLVGSEGTFKISGGYTERVGKAWATLSGGYDTSDGYRDHSGYENKYATLGFGYDNQKNSVTRLNLSYQDTEFDQPGALTKAQLDQDPTQIGTSIGNGTTEYRRIAVSNEYGAADAPVKLLTDAGVSLADEYFNAFADLPFATQYNRDLEGYFFAPKLRITTDDFTFTPGIDVNHDRVDVVGTTPVDSTVKRFVLSPYLLSEWRASEQFTFSAGYRHEWNKTEARERVVNDTGERRDTADAWQLAVNYRPTETLRFYAKYDRTYRFPATDEMAYYQGFPSPVFFDANLKPETSDNFEVGANVKRDGWNGGVSTYYLKTEDEIFFNGFPVFQNQNLPETRRVGAQANVGYTAKIAGFRSQIDFVDADLVKGAGTVLTGPLRQVPEWRLTNTVFVKPVENWTLSVTHRHLGESYMDDFYATTNPPKVKSEEVFDAKITFRATTNWSVYAGVNNIFDRTTVSYASTSFGTDSYYPGLGRFIYTGASVQF
ncbi:TonB-dependent receptor [Rariglobus hedericola]|uniref:TonB-dependent receptor n=1 Tax=Rariglobus hedericola TaxID=2597822 RepID=A0A556QKC7_9BACT|nr:TonB-dependent receptor [Rariglobus hedericola]TSJ77077.1 TonB-dependent receptor [Rariglobus hedericola]